MFREFSPSPQSHMANITEKAATTTTITTTTTETTTMRRRRNSQLKPTKTFEIGSHLTASATCFGAPVIFDVILVAAVCPITAI